MKKYIKPEFEIIRFDVQSSIMNEATPTPTGAPVQPMISANTYEHIPESIDKKVWTKYGDDENWNWE